MYPDPFYNTGGQYPPMFGSPDGFSGNPMWMPVPPGFSPMPFPGPFNEPYSGPLNMPFGGADDFRPGAAQNSQSFGYPPTDFGPPPPPDFSGYYPMQ